MLEKGRLETKSHWIQKAKVRQIGESLVIWVEAMQRLEDVGKNGWNMAHFNVMMVDVNLGPQQIGRTE